MRSGRRSKPDSSGLLIDTMCNAIGGLVLIAIVVAILGASANSPDHVIDDLAERIENEEKRNELIGEERARLQEKLTSMEGIVDDGYAIDEQEINILKNELNAKRAALEKAQNKLRAKKRQIQEIRSTDPAIIVSDHRERNRRMEIEQKELQAKIRQSNQNLKEIRETNIQTINLPSEKHNSRPDFMVVYNNRIYPFRNKDIWSPPSGLFRVMQKTSNSIRFRPIPGKGYGINDPKVDSFLRRISGGDGACMLYFYPDSYGLFDELYNLLKKHDMNHGVNFIDKDGHLAFSTTEGTDILPF